MNRPKLACTCGAFGGCAKHPGPFDPKPTPEPRITPAMVRSFSKALREAHPWLTVSPYHSTRRMFIEWAARENSRKARP